MTRNSPRGWRDVLPTLVNFRDAGGIDTVQGGRIRSGMLYRSDSLQDISHDEAAYLVDELGIRTVIDLRSPRETLEEGRGPLVDHLITYINVPLLDVDHAIRSEPGRIIEAFYINHMLDDPSIPVAVEAVALGLREPVLIHCAAGKDRTGLTVALVQLLCGAEVAGARENFMVTAANMEAIRARLGEWQRYARNMARLSPEIYECKASSFDGLLRTLVETQVDAETWALRRGIPPGVIEQLRTRLVDHKFQETVEKNQ